MNSKWLRCCVRRPQASIYLVCFPWAGGGTSYYAGTWGKTLPDHVEVYGVILPGRENRFSESFCTDWSLLTMEISQEIHKTLRNKPLVFWGHSLGGGISYETARCMKTQYNVELAHLLISGSPAPQVPRKSPGVTHLTNKQLVDKITLWGGTPKVILDNKDIMDISVKILRADLTLLKNYRFIPDTGSCRNPTLSCPITCFDGNSDLHEQEGWSQVSSGEYQRHVIPGGHFYFMNSPENSEKQLLDIIKSILRPGI